MKWCNRCKQEKPLSEFGRRENGTKPTSQCKKCNCERMRERREKHPRECKAIKRKCYINHLDKNRSRGRHQSRLYRLQHPAKVKRIKQNSDFKRKYGITRDEYLDLVKAQNGRCAICAEIPPVALRVDHCHDSGVVRALLCDLCNKGLGQFRDSPLNLMRAARYLARHNKKARAQ